MAWVDVSGPTFWSILRSATFSGNNIVYDGSSNDLLIEIVGTWAEKLRPSRVRVTYTSSYAGAPAHGLWRVFDGLPIPNGSNSDHFSTGSNAQVIECDNGWNKSLRYIIIPTPGNSYTLTVTKIEYEIDYPVFYDYIDIAFFKDGPNTDYEMNPPRVEYLYSSTSQIFDFNTGSSYQWPDTSKQPNHLRVILETDVLDSVDRVLSLVRAGVGATEIEVWSSQVSMTSGDNEFNFFIEKIPVGEEFKRFYMKSADGSTSLQPVKIKTFTLSIAELPAVEKSFAVDRYELKMTGTPELILPMSNFNARLLSGSPSYLQAVVPGGEDFISEISARALEDLVVTWKSVDSETGEVLDSAEIVTVNFENMAVARGANKRSLTLTGHKQKTYSTPKTVEISGHSIENGQTDIFTFNPNIYPKDVFSGQTISTMTINVNTSGTSMALTYE